MSGEKCHGDGELCGFCEHVAARFVNSDGNVQLVTDGPGAQCPECGYPERHRIYGDQTALIADGCPSCETSRATERPVGGAR